MHLGKNASKNNLHRRARSSVGTNRKASATRDGKFKSIFYPLGNKSQPRGSLLPPEQNDEDLEDIDMVALNNH
jgi:hypothetical protein